MPAASPGKRQVDEREAARPHSETDGEAVGEIAGVEAVGALSDFALLEQQVGADGAPQRVLDALLQRDQIRPAEPVVVIRCQQTLSVEVGSAQRRLKIEGDRI